MPITKQPVRSDCFNEEQSRQTLELIGENGWLFTGSEFPAYLAIKLGVSWQEVRQVLMDYFDNSTETIHIQPKPTPRPRAGIKKFGNKTTAMVYHPEEYTDYKTLFTNELLLRTYLKQRHYYSLFAICYLPFPEGEARMRTYEERPHEKKPDFDNLIKGFVDAVVESGLLIDDGKLHSNCILKRYTRKKSGRIEFKLLSYPEKL